MENKEVRYVSIEDIIPNRFQPRIAFGEKELNELADSIKQHGVLQPLLLRQIGDKFEIVAGERRYKASCIAGLNNVPAIIIAADDKESAEIAITENIQRKDLTAIEEAQSYKKLLDKGSTQDDVAKKLGISQSAVANKLRLLSLTDEAQEALLNGRISERHARSLLRITDPSMQINLLNRIINEKLTVRQTDEELNKMLGISTEVKMPTDDNFKVEIPDFEGMLTHTAPVVNMDPIENVDEIKPVEKLEVNEPQDIISVFDDKLDTLSPFTEEREEILETPHLINPIETFEPVEFKSNDILEEFKETQEINNSIEESPKEKRYTTAINSTRDFTKELESEGFKVTSEEYDFEDMYQIVIKIKKDE